MKKLNNLGYIIVGAAAGASIWDGYREAKLLAESLPINEVSYDAQDILFPIKVFGAIVNYDSLEELLSLRHSYSQAPDEHTRDRVFSAKIDEAIQKLREENETSRTM